MKKKHIAAGIFAIDTQTGKVLLDRRSMDSYFPNTWGLFGGTFDKIDEFPKETAKREFWEETKVNVPYKISKKPFHINEENIYTFYTYIGLFDGQFDVIISDESAGFGWFDLESLPENLIPGLKLLMEEKGNEIKSFIIFI